MQAIEGDGSPWSYLSASILNREAAEFGAIWHGCVWSDQTILSKPPRQTDEPDAEDDARQLTGDAPVGNWTWHGAAPHTWRPTYADMESSREVVLHIHSPIGGEEIYRATDTYPVVGSYEGRTENGVVHWRPIHRLLTDVLGELVVLKPPGAVKAERAMRDRSKVRSRPGWSLGFPVGEWESTGE